MKMAQTEKGTVSARTAFDALQFWQTRAEELEGALKRLTMMARTSGGTAGRDEALCKACDDAEAALSRALGLNGQE